jgi:uncharacterized membrane protein
MKFTCRSAFFFVVSFFSLSCFATQTTPCVSGTLANVLGTSCSIGFVSYTFANNFSGFHQITDASNTLQTTPLTADAIGFVPILTETQSGFKLVANFHETTDTVFFSESDISFSYSLAVNGNFQIMDETGTISGSVTQSFFEATIIGFDSHCFTNSGCEQVFQQVAFIPGFGFSSVPTSSATLPIPGLVSPGTGAGGLSFTTQLTAFAFAGDSATLDSNTYLFTVVPQVPPPPLAKLNYTNIDIPGVATSVVEGINDAGDTVGLFADTTGTHAFMQDSNGVHVLNFPAGTTATPLAINNRGDIVGSIRDSARKTHGFLLQDGVLTILDFPGAVLTIAEGINDHGEISGLYQPNFSSIHGFRRDSEGFTSIDDPGARTPGFTEAIGINNRGDISGFFLDSFGRDNPFILSSGTFQDVPVSGGYSPFLEGLNDQGVAVGGYRDLHGGSHGFVMNGGTVQTVDFPGSRSTTAVQINTPGRILGRYVDSAGRAHSFLADRAPEGGMTPGQPDTSDTQPSVRVCTESDQVTDRLDLKNPQSCPIN